MNDEKTRIASLILECKGTLTAEATAAKFQCSEDKVWGIWSGRRWRRLGDPRQVSERRPRIPAATIAAIKAERGRKPPRQVAIEQGVSVASVYAIWNETRHAPTAAPQHRLQDRRP